jgi:ABC-type transporter Mla subunit MlaD
VTWFQSKDAERLNSNLQRAIGLLEQLIKQGASQMANLTALTASVAQNTTVIGSAMTLIQGFSAQLAAAGTDPAALAALQSQLDTSDTALAAAVAANTPAAVPAPAAT